MAPNRTRAFHLERVVGALAEVSTVAALMEALTLHLKSYDSSAETMLGLDGTFGNLALTPLKQHPGFQGALQGRTSIFEDGAGCIAFAPVKAHGTIMGALVTHFGTVCAGEVDREALTALATQTGLVYKSLEKSEEAADMARLARIDALTNLPNRRAFEERFEMEWQRAIRSGTTLALIIVDVDFFGAYNERYGHPAGDVCLQAVAGTLVSEMRRPEDFLARFGGEEFVALLPACGQTDAVNHAERMAAVLRGAKIRHEATTLGLVTASFGVAITHPADSQAPAALLDAADAALYEAKQHGRNRVSAGTYTSNAPVSKRIYSAAHNVPHYITEFIGREAGLQMVSEQLRQARLVTLVGPGGIGKTRLAVESATALARDYADGALYVDLSVADGHAPVASLIARALQLRENPQQLPEDAILEQLRSASKLLLLDNCETAIEEVAKIVDVILTGCANVRILATSREPLTLPGEALIPVEPMDADEAVSLFINRSQLAHAGTGPPVPPAELRKVCERLDYLPFAIELAASQPFASVQAYAVHAAPDLAAWRKRGALVRQQSIFNLIEWSYSRLTAAEQRAFRFLSIASGAFGVEDAAAVCDLSGADATNITASLTRKSLLSSGSAGRARMLELTAEYGRAMLRENAELAEARERHAAHYSAVAERIDQAYVDGRMDDANDLIHNAGANLYSALDHLLSTDSTINLGASMAANLALFWEFHGLTREGRAWLDRALLRITALDPHMAAKLHYGIAVLASAQADTAALLDHGERALRQHCELGDETAAAHDRRVLAIGKMLEGRFDEADALLHESIRTFERIGYTRGVGAAYMNLGVIAMDWKEDFAAAERYFKICLDLYRRQDPGFILAVTLINLGELAFYRNDFAAAASHEREAVELLQRLKHPFQAIAQGILGRALTALNMLTPAFAALRDALEGYREFHSPKYLSASLQYFARWLLSAGRPEDAARIMGFIDAYRMRENVVPATAGAQPESALRNDIETALGTARYRALYDEGAAADIAAAYNYCDADWTGIAS